MTSKQTPKKNTKKASPKKAQLTLNQMNPVIALNDKQDKSLDLFDGGQNLVMLGSAGTGKTFLAIAAALHEVLDTTTPYKKVVIMRSAVPTRDIGFLPGSEEEKIEVYTKPYVAIMDELFKAKGAWARGSSKGQIEFEATSYIRGMTFNDTIIVVDEIQNLSYHENESVITRVGNNCRIILAGDFYQTDFTRDRDKKGLGQFIKILDKMESFSIVEFGHDDIVRSELVKEYIVMKDEMARNEI